MPNIGNGSTHAARHAQVRQVREGLRKLAGAVQLDIANNGKSFTVERVLHAKKFKRLGLLGKRERVEMCGGRFAVESAPGQGTTIRAQIPLANGAS